MFASDAAFSSIVCGSLTAVVVTVFPPSPLSSSQLLVATMGEATGLKVTFEEAGTMVFAALIKVDKSDVQLHTVCQHPLGIISSYCCACNFTVLLSLLYSSVVEYKILSSTVDSA